MLSSSVPAITFEPLHLGSRAPSLKNLCNQIPSHSNSLPHKKYFIKPFIKMQNLQYENVIFPTMHTTPKHDKVDAKILLIF